MTYDPLTEGDLELLRGLAACRGVTDVAGARSVLLMERKEPSYLSFAKDRLRTALTHDGAASKLLPPYTERELATAERLRKQEAARR